MNEVDTYKEKTNEDSANIIYILYLVGLIFGVTGIVGVVMAYIYKDESPDWVKTHFQFQIRTFWIGAIYLVIGTLLSMVLIGFFILFFWTVWLIIRCVKGMSLLNDKKPHPNPTSWMF